MKQKMILSALFVLVLVSFTEASQQKHDENADPNIFAARFFVDENKENTENNMTHGLVNNLPIQDEKNKRLSQNFYNLKQQVQNCLDKANIKDLNEFLMLLSNDNTQNESFYEQECKKYHITLWPSQTTFKEAYLGEIFYPSKEIGLFYEHESNEYLLQRFDVLWSLAVSARFNNPLALYYLARRLEVHIYMISDCKADFITKFYKKALAALEAVEGNDAVYLLRSKDYTLSCRGAYSFNTQKAFELYAQSKSKESQLQMLLMKGEYEGYEDPTHEDYNALAETYPKAYMEIVKKFTNGFDEKARLLKHTYEKGYYPALLELGALYQEANQKEEALKFYEAYGAKGYPKGYLYCSTLHVGRVDLNKGYQKKTDDEINKAIQFLIKGHNLHHPEASYRLGILFLEQHRRNPNTTFKAQALEYFEKAAFLGEMSAYRYVDSSHNIIDHLFARINQILYFIGYYS